MAKVATILSVICGAVGVPWAALVWLAGGTKSRPGLSAQDLQWGLPLPVIAIVFGLISAVLSLMAAPKRKVSAIISIGLVLVCSAVSGLLLLTYFDTHH